MLSRNYRGLGQGGLTPFPSLLMFLLQFLPDLLEELEAFQKFPQKGHGFGVFATDHRAFIGSTPLKCV